MTYMTDEQRLIFAMNAAIGRGDEQTITSLATGDGTAPRHVLTPARGWLAALVAATGRVCLADFTTSRNRASRPVATTKPASAAIY